MSRVQIEFDIEQKHGNAKVTIDGREVEFSKLTLYIDDMYPAFFVEPPKKETSPVKMSKNKIVATIDNRNQAIERE